MWIDDYLENAASAAIGGHVRADGDCVGSCLGLFNYIRESRPDLRLDVYVPDAPEKFSFLSGYDCIRQDGDGAEEYDVFFALDCGDAERLGPGLPGFRRAKKTICIDHHKSNQGYADENYIDPAASSASELVYGMMDPARISRETAECIYTGIVGDTGVFRYSCTSSRTMRIAGELMDMGIDYPAIVDRTFDEKTYPQLRITGYAFENSRLHFDGRCISCVLTQKDLDRFDAEMDDLDGIVSMLRSTEHVEVSVFIHEDGAGRNKLSLRSASYVDVSEIVSLFGGGGHARAAGATADLPADILLERVLGEVEKRL